jgi:hypothetical protein
MRAVALVAFQSLGPSVYSAVILLKGIFNAETQRTPRWRRGRNNSRRYCLYEEMGW